MDESLKTKALHQEKILQPSQEEETKTRHHSYCRKQKSLGLLCTNFLSLYNRDGVETVGLDDAASQLGVERRRIYDIVNVFESVGILTRKAKNQYTWNGFEGIPKALYELKLLNEDEDRRSSCKQFLSSKVDSRREKSLALLTQNFVRLFICKDANLVSLDEAAKALLGETLHSCQMRTKIRRLYDIANVLSSLNLIEKTHHTDNKKPAFRWLGIDGAVGLQPSESMVLKRRVFGTDITNTSCKKSKVLPTNNERIDLNTKTHIAHDGNQELTQQQHQQSKLNSKGVVFGPFRPVNLAKVGDSEKNKVNRVHDSENRAPSYRLQYKNQALSDIFAHYMEAWKSWYVEVVGSPPIQQFR